MVILGGWNSEAFVDASLQGRGVDHTIKGLLEGLPEIRDVTVEDNPSQGAFKGKEDVKENEDREQVVDHEAEEQEFLATM